MKKQYLTINQAAARLGVSAKTLRRWEEKGTLIPKRSIGNQRRYLLSDIEKREKKVFTINEAAARLFVSANTLRRWEEKGIISPKRSIGNQRLYTLADIQRLEAMHYPTIDEKESNSVIARSEERTTKQSQVDNEIFSLPTVARNDKEKLVEKERFFDLASLESPTSKEEQPVLQSTPIKADATFTEEPEIDPFNPSSQKPSFSWNIAKPPAQWSVALFSFIGVLLILATLNKFTDPAQILALIPYLNITKNIKMSSDNGVLASETKKRDYALRVSVPVEFLSTASVSGKLTAPNILYSVVAGDNITISGDPQNPTISSDLAVIAGDGISLEGDTIINDDPGSAQNIFGKIKVGSTTISAGNNTDTFELAAGSNITLSTDTSNKKITIAADTSSAGIDGLILQEGDTTVSSTITTVDLLGGDFDVGESPTGEANVSLASTLTSVTGVAGAFSVGTNLTVGSDTISDFTGTNTGISVSSGALSLVTSCADNEILKYTSGGGWACATDSQGLGDVVGPASSTDNALVRFNGATGKSIQNSGIIIDDSDNVTGVNALTIAPATDLTGFTLTGTNTTTQKLAYLNAHNASGTIFDISYGATQTLTGSLIGQAIDLNNGQVTATNQNVTGQKITLPTLTNTNAAGTENLLGLQVTFGSGAGINQNGAGATNFSALDVSLPALTQTQGTLTANGLAVTLPSSITTGGVANGLLISPTGVGAGTLNGVNVATISAAGAGNETAINIGTNWDTVLRVNGTPVINGQGVTLATGGGTGQSSYAVGDILYADGTGTLAKLPIGNTNDYVLKVSSGVPVWGTVAGSPCGTCVITDPSSSATNTIAPTGQSTTGLIVKQTSTASPTNDIFNITDSTGSTSYFRVDKDGNVYPSASIGNTITLTPTTDTTALTLVGTNVPTASLQYINSKNSSGTIFNLAYGAAQTLSTSSPLTGIGVDLSTNVTATNANVTATNLTLPSTTNTITSGTKSIKGVSISAGGGLNQNGAGGTTTFTAFDATLPALTQTAGTLTGYGVNITTPSSITTGGTAAALNVTASGVGAGNLYGLNISGITAGAGTENALNIGSGWDTVLSVNGTTVIDGSGNFNISNATGTLPVANGGSPFEQNLGAIFPRIPTEDLLIGGIATNSATFHVFGSINSGTNPVASIAAASSFAGLVIDNAGTGDLLTASSSGQTRFTINQNGDVQVGNYTGSPNLQLAGSDANTVGPSLTWAEDPARYVRGRYDSSANRLIFENDTGNPILAMGRNGTNSVGIGTTTFAATLDVRGNLTNGGTIPIASLSARTSYAGLVVDNWGAGDLFTASSAGTNRFVIKQNGNIGIGTTTPLAGLDIRTTELRFGPGTATFTNKPTLSTETSDALTFIAVNNGSNNTDYRFYIEDDTTDSLSFYGGSCAGTCNSLSSSGQVMTIKAGGDVGIGSATTTEKLTITGGAIGGNTAFLPSYAAWNAYGTGDGGAGIYNDSGSYQRLMLVGNDSGGTVRRVGLWDYVTVNSALGVGNGTTDPAYTLDVRASTTGYVGNITNNTGSGQGERIQIRTTGTPGNFMLFQSLSGASDYTNGWIVGSGGGVSYGSASDIRLKENIIDTHYGINDLMNVQVADFNYIKSPNDTTTGFLAQQLYSVYPPAVTVGTSGDDTSVPWGVDYGKLTPLIIKGVQDQQRQLESLKASVSAILAGSLNTESLTVNNLQTQTLTLGGTNVNDKLLGLSSGIASVSAEFASPLQTQMEFLNSQLSSLTSRVASLEANLAILNSASGSALLTNNLGGFTASTGAELSLDKLDVNGAIISDSLNVLSYATINELSVTGTIRTGLLTIKSLSNGGASISTLNGNLKLQEQGFGGIDILDGKITIDTSGNLESKGTITAKKFNVDESNVLSASVGEATIPLNGTSVVVNTTAVTKDSHIFVTSRTKTGLPLTVTTQTPGAYFKVEIIAPALQPIKFDWWIVN